MSWTIERRGRVAVVTMTTNPVNAQNQVFLADLHDAFDRLERDHPDSPVVLTGTGRRFSAGLDLDEPEVASWAARLRVGIVCLWKLRAVK
jgi:enoyl-CoA hydratase